MPTVTPLTTVISQPKHFRRHLHRAVIPAVFAVVVFALFAYRIPDALWVAIPGLCFCLLLCVLLHGGLIISHEGIAWYILRPTWRYRTIPWQAVLDVRKTLFGLLHPIRLIVKDGRYEPWLWGTPRPNRRRDIAIWPYSYTGGEAVWDVIHHFWSSPNRGAGVEAANECVSRPDAAADSGRHNGFLSGDQTAGGPSG